jgi:hypothetical protein
MSTEKRHLQPCLLKYLVRGVSADRPSQQALTSELGEMLSHASAITVLPVVEGFSVELEFDDIKPFTTVSFEPYVAEHVLGDAVRLRCESQGSPEIQLLKSRF